MKDSVVKLRYKDEIESVYASTLAPYATKKPKENSRVYPEEVRETENRSDFQRDRDRIIHSQAFRRMMYKTQVFVNHEGDHFRTRLTHSLEVAQFARGISKSLALNEDLAEAIALGHDLGHTPFGHAAEEVFTEKMKNVNLNDFYHNEQSVRVVDFLEDRDIEKYNGLNLTYEVREGILKHNNDRTGAFEPLNPQKPCSSLEGQIVKLVDTIAYTCHDLDDGIKSGILKNNCINNPNINHQFLEIKKEILDVVHISLECDERNSNKNISSLIHYFISQLTENTYENLKKNNISSLEDVKEASANEITLVCFNESTAAFFKRLKSFVFKAIYSTSTVQIMDAKAKTVIEELFDAFYKNEKLLPPNWLYKLKENKEHIENDEQLKTRIICDYIACMTDRYALEEHEKLFNPRVKI